MAFEFMGVFVRVPVVLVDPLLLKDFRFLFVGSRISGTGTQHRNPVHAAIQVKVGQAPLDCNLLGRFGIILGIATIRNDDSDFYLRVVLRQVIKRHIECAIGKGEDLGFPFVGEAPDLGAFEYGLSSSSVASSGSVAESSSGTARIMPQRTPDGETPARKGYRDLKGRHYEKLIRYRVMF